MVESTAPELVDRIRGLVFGMALGDAIGLSTEFMKKSDVVKTYSSKFAAGSYTFDDIVWNNHNRRWARGDWTDDTDQAILIMQSFADEELVPSQEQTSAESPEIPTSRPAQLVLFARRLQ